MNNKRLTSLLALWIVLILPAAAIHADGPDAHYSADGSALFWFMQITDTHVSTFFNTTYDEHLLDVLNEGTEIIRPWFVVVTGDLTDGTDGMIYGTGPHQEEWDEYRMLVEETGMSPDYYFDIPGNHDSYGDGFLTYYLANSISGRAFDTTQPYWGLSFEHGKYNFLSGAGTCNDGLQWWWDNALYTEYELAEIEEHYATLGPGDFSMFFGHHPLQEVSGGDALVDILLSNETTFYACGHKHDFVTELNDGLLRYRIESLGQGSNNNIAIYAVDNNTLSQGVTDTDDPWPFPLVTAPAAAAFENNGDWEDNIFVPGVPNDCAEAPLRVLVFDTAPVSRVAVKIDSDEWIELAQREQTPEQWRGRFDATGLSPGLHTLAIYVVGSQVRDQEIRFRVIEATCDIGEEDDDIQLDEGEIWLPGDIEDGDTADGDDLFVDGDEQIDGEVILDGDGDGEMDGDPIAEGDALSADGDEWIDGDYSPEDGDVAGSGGGSSGGNGGVNGGGGCRTATSTGFSFFLVISALLTTLLRRRKAAMQ